MVCEDGAWQCAPPPTVESCDECQPGVGADCIDDCGDVYAASCVDGRWECPILSGCMPVYPEGARWNAAIGNDDEEEASRVLIDDANVVYVATRFRGTLTLDDKQYTSVGGFDVVVSRYDAVGNREWTAQYGGPDDDFAQGLAFLPSGSVLMVMSSAPIDQTSGPAQLMEISQANGVLLSEQALGFDIDAGQETRLAVQPGNGDIVVAGSVAGAVSVLGAGELAAESTETDLFVARFNEAMFPMWGRRFGGTGFDELHGVDIDASGRVFLAGTSDSPSLTFDDVTVAMSDGFDGFVAALEPVAGEALWVRRLASPADASFDDVKAYGDGGVAVTGTFSGSADLGDTTLNGTDDEARYGLVARFADNGDLRFADRLGEASPLPGYATYWKVEPLGLGDLMVFGSPIDGAVNDGDITVKRYSGVGALLQTQRYDSGLYDAIIDVDSNGYVLAVVGTTDGALDLGLGPMPSALLRTSFVAVFVGDLPSP